MKISVFSVAMVSVLLVTASAQAFPFGSKSDTTSKTETTKTESSGQPYQSQQFRNMDKNHDGKISEDEFLADQRAEFTRLDQDHDKSISPDELDLPPGLNAEQKAVMRKQMQDRDNMMNQRNAERTKNMQEEQKRMQAEQDARAKALAAVAARPTTPSSEKKTEDVKKEEPKKEEVKKSAETSYTATGEKVKAPVTNGVTAAAPAFTSGSAGKVTMPATTHGTTPAAKH